MAQVSTIGLDLEKNVFQVHGIDAERKVVVRRSLRRGKVVTYFWIDPFVALAHFAWTGSS